MSREARSIYFPYCLKQLQDGHWVVLNRDYKPLGCHPQKSYDYDNIPVELRLKSIPAAKARHLSYDGSGIKDRSIYLYSDGTIPTSDAQNMANYLGKISILMKIKTVRDARNG